MSKGILQTPRRWPSCAPQGAAVYKPPSGWFGGLETAVLGLVDHHDRADWNLSEEFSGGIARKANATV
jgi:hypothetical protein